MASLKDVLPAASRILESYYLCDYCLGRLFVKQLNLSSGRLLGKKIRKGVAQSECYICRNVYSDLKPLLALMLDSCSKYDFETFVVGTRIRPSVVDRDDFIRSKFKLIGSDGIKTDITRSFSRLFSKKTKKTLDAADPDLTMIVDIKGMACETRTKPVVLYGRYTKNRRGMPQKQKPCENCSGKGCKTCGLHGITGHDSVEGRISGMLFSKFGCTTVKFTWIGGEDKSSLVLGAGRPFFAQLQNPERRKPRLARKIDLGSISLYGCKVIQSLPKAQIRFYSTIKIRVSTKEVLDRTAPKKIRSALSGPVVVYDTLGKRSEKSVKHVKYRKISGNEFVLTVDAEGGLPIKRFVTGDDVSPGIGQILDNECVCVRFDFMGIYQQ